MVNNLLKMFYQTSAYIFETLIGKTVKSFTMAILPVV